ncbi:Alpha-D-kanosaminyltransferase [Caulifigura coniformis]|uniref:Alpha-D-kanosaminyltransferase n=1 Tax=Caulifigura coniformis TaxID=2527983 RepID=A0A517SGM1_9PLAN|nr:glycosyltransferase family 4 protein [Caulifigura coniformis]QDT55271.1 Alpha-D-kanosaminyltransferase [Caulifigura coniformis]
MNVVHVITRLIVGGAQENTLLTVEEQHRAWNDNVTLVTGPPLGPEGSLLDRARGGGFPVVVVDELRRNIDPSKDWKSWRTLKRLFRELKPDIVHTHSSKAGIIGRAAAHALGIPVVHTIHGAAFHFGQSRWAYNLYRRAEQWAARRTDHFISVADDMTAEYVAAGIASPDRFTTVYSGFDVEPFLNPARSPAQVRAAWNIPDDAVIVGKIGRLFPLKGHEFVIAAAPEIIRRCPNAYFVLVGDGILREEYERRIQQAGIADRFRFTGLVRPEEIPDLLPGMDLLVHTSQWEGLARVLPQALIAGRAVVSFDVGGAREVVIPGQTGCLIPRDDTASLIDAVCHLINDPAERLRFGTEGRRRFTDQFRYQTMTRRIREVYARVLAAN